MLASLVGGAVAAAVVGCTAGSTGPDDPSAEPRTSAASPASPSPPPPEPTPPPTLAPEPAWTAGPGEVRPEIKTTATRFVETVGSWADGGGDVPAVEGRLRDAGFDPAMAGQVPGLVDDGATASSVTVVYPQYGGLTRTTASVMVTTTQHLLDDDGRRQERQSTVDVRLAMAPADGSWKVTGVSPDPPAPASGGASPAAQAVLDNPNVRLPGAAASDVREGRVSSELLQLLDGLAAGHVLDVQVFSSGHPTNVFDTDRQSRHSMGRAVDVWRIDGHPVVDPATPRELLEGVMREAAGLGATEVGGPFDLNGGGPGFFTDAVHQDHLHLAITAGQPPAQP